MVHLAATPGFPENCYVVHISAKSASVFLNPFKGCNKVHLAVIARASVSGFFGEQGMGHITKRPEPVIYGN
jgi:hypothetical protein